MQSLSRFLTDAQMAWLTSSINCCAAGEDVESCEPEKSMRIINGQPQLISPPLSQPPERPPTASAFERPETRGNEWARTRSRTSSRGSSFTLKGNLSSRASNRMVIGAPYNFQHHTETSYVREPERVVLRKEPKLRPLELSIYLPGHRLSPLPEFGPHFNEETKNRPLVHMRSESALEFRVPRKPVLSTVMERRSMNTEELLDALSNDLPHERPTRLRANTEPLAYERVKSALLENMELDKKLRELDDAIERRSIYLASRPVSRASRAESRQERRESIYSEFTEPMPPITELPLHHVHHRPHTAPSRPRRMKSLDSSLHAPKFLKERPLPPPLPLVLQTPQITHRRKSLSRVSSWLFPSGSEHQHSRHMSLDSVTNTPRPVTSRDGFYQCVEVKEIHNPHSVSSVSSIESEIDGNEDYEATSWSDSPSLGYGARHPRGLGYEVRISADSKRLQVAPPSRDGARTFGGSEKGEEVRWSMAYGYGSDSVGVAI
ncbi:uncharacterized protein EAF01_007566 [Botrytis porri]|uniref:Uncharacterized protein n=1 Tax=Botrytis porri TaxID=87229 RepID=A0A4Z1KVN9_9HELO|nr:uncharacterized protein EAF01_007566 [Botrytis porri]KAF7900264.1 hypothetical protein EAF01_007566 [Botrytis porri]TGO88580.1 hypothetical protein BPOR_0154g00200 [Botrytis porri]